MSDPMWQDAPQRPAVLDWRAAAHWHRIPRPCRYCRRPTNLRDSDNAPSHKTCAEAHGGS